MSVNYVLKIIRNKTIQHMPNLLIIIHTHFLFQITTNGFTNGRRRAVFRITIDLFANTGARVKLGIGCIVV